MWKMVSLQGRSIHLPTIASLIHVSSSQASKREVDVKAPWEVAANDIRTFKFHCIQIKFHDVENSFLGLSLIILLPIYIKINPLKFIYWVKVTNKFMGKNYIIDIESTRGFSHFLLFSSISLIMIFLRNFIKKDDSNNSYGGC